jgi:hypothetical protein
VERLSAEAIAQEIHKVRRPVRLAKDGTPIPMTLPTRVARMYLNMPDEWTLQPLNGVTTTPLLAPDGSIGISEGYDSSTGIWLANVPPMRIPGQPAHAEAAAALYDVRHAVRTFPFADSKRRWDPELGTEVTDLNLPPGYAESAFIVALLTAVCRSSLPLAPGVMITAPEISGSGTGKGMLVRTISAVAFGITPQAFTRGHDSQEFEKRVASHMIAAGPIIFIDNLNAASLRSDFLASLLTEPSIGTRLLGRSRMLRLTNRAFVALTGNGLTISEDLLRRFLPCELDARCEHADHRKFDPGFLANIEQRRAKLLGACLTIWRWGRQSATDLLPGRPIGSYEEWAAWCRDPLLALGCCDPIERIERIKADDPARSRIESLFKAWYAQHGSRPMMVTELADSVRTIIDPRRQGPHYVGLRLSQLTGTCVCGLRLMRPEVAGTAAYALVTLDEAGFSPTPSCPVSLVPEEPAAVDHAPRRSGLALEYGRGRIRIDTDFDPATLARVLGVLDHSQ